MQCLKLIKKHELGSIKWVNVHYSSPLHPRPAEGYLFFRAYMIVYIIKRIACLICNLQEDVCFIIKSWSRLILECAYMILKIYLHLHMQTQKKSLRLTCRQFWNIFSLCSSNICAESFAQQVANQKPYFMWRHSERKHFHKAVHIDKSQVPFNALTKKGQLITVCLRATCKDINQISLENMSKEECSPPNLHF